MLPVRCSIRSLTCSLGPLLRGFRSSAGVLSVYEAQTHVENLRKFGVADVGSRAWMAQHEVLQQLNIQAHHDALSGHDEFVKEAFLTHEQVPTLVHDLLVIEAWKTQVFPLLAPKLPEAASLKVYMVLFHESLVCNLLELLAFHEEVLKSAGDAVIELIDYCYRHAVQLAAGEFDYEKAEKKEGGAAAAAKTAAAQASEPVAAALQRQCRDMAFPIATSAVALLRFVTEHLAALPVAAMARLLDSHDVLMTLIPLLQRDVWTRRRGAVTEKFIDGKWVAVSDGDLASLTKLEGQLWLTVYNLMLDEGCRRKYEWHTARREQAAGLKRHFSPALVDQLPMLAQLQRMVEEMALMPPPERDTRAALAIIEQVPEMRDAIVGAISDVGALAERQLREHFAVTEAERRAEAARMAATFSGDGFDDVLEQPRCAKCGVTATQRCSGCKMEWYCGRKCQLDSWKAHKALCKVIGRTAKK